MKMDRRRFLAVSAFSGFAAVSRGGKGDPFECTLRQLTRGPNHHFFGYYGICPWNRSGNYLVCLESAFQDRMPEPGEAAAIGLVDAQTGAFEKVTETRAWNLQQGAMMYWNPLAPETEIIHNDQQGDEVVSVVHNVRTGKRRVLPRPVSALSHDGERALSLTYGRLGRLRKVVGYGAAKDPNPDDPAPENDGVFLMDMRSGRTELVVPISEVYARILPKFPALRGCHMWFNHVVFNRGDTRFFFLARTNLDAGGERRTAMFTANVDGTQLREVVGFDKSVSHFDWRNDEEIIATFVLDGSGRKHVLFTDGKKDYRVVGNGFLDFDGHCSFAPDQNRLVTDHKIRRSLEQALLVYDMKTGQGRELCRFNMKETKFISGDVRCDFHPRWNRAGDQICFDAIEPKTGTRQMHIVSFA